VEVQVSWVDLEPARQFTVRQLLARLAEQLEHAKAQRVPESLDLLRAIDRQDFKGLGRVRRRVHLCAL
jgi:hypothetical protein